MQQLVRLLPRSKRFSVFLVFVFAILSILMRVHYKHVLRRPARGRRIPGPPQLPGLGNFLQLRPHIPNIAELFLIWTRTYGPVVKFCAAQFGPVGVFTTDPAVIKHVLVTGFNDGRWGRGPLFSDQYFELLGNGIFNSNGAQWQAHRDFAKGLFQPDALRSTVSVFEKYANQLVSHLESRGLTSGVDMQDYFMRYTLSSFGEAGFGAQLHAIEQEVNQFAVAFDYVQTKTAERGNIGRLWKLLPRDKEFDRHMKYLNTYCETLIQERRAEPVELLEARKDLLSKILLARHEDGSRYSDQDVVDFLKNFLMAGRDTTAVLLTFAVYALSQLPGVEARVLAEIKEVIGDAPLTMENVQRLRYLKAVLQETLRLYPSVPIDLVTCMVDSDVLPGDYMVERNDVVLYSAYVLHRLPELWPEPLVFNPERFLGEAPKPFTYMPFHGGPRLCLGMDMAYLEARVALVVLLRKFKLAPPPGFEPQLKVKIMLTCSNGMPMNLTPREPV